MGRDTRPIGRPRAGYAHSRSSVRALWCIVATTAFACGASGDTGTGTDALVSAADAPAPGRDGGCSVPPEGRAEDVGRPDRVVGNGTPASCTAEAFTKAVAEGGVITFDCGPDPITITVDEPARIYNDASKKIVIDGGERVTLSGGGRSRILYMNTCDEDLHWTTSHCDDQEYPQLTVQHITFANGSSKKEAENDGGGAIWARGGRLKIVSARFIGNVCADTGPDVGGGAVRVFDQFEGRPVHVVDSTFGGEDALGNVCSNGGALSSIGVSWSIYNSTLTHNRAVGRGGNPAQAGTPGGGSGGAIYNDGNTMTLHICGSAIERNAVNTHGSAIFFVSNDHTGHIELERSTIVNNEGGSWYPTYPQISGHEDTPIYVTDSTLEP